LVVADFNGDGIPDIAVANQSGLQNGDGSVAVLLGAGGGNFLPAVIYDSAGFTATALVATDANGDGYPDLLIANNCAQSSCSPQQGSVAVLLNVGSSAPGTFAPAVTYLTPGRTRHLRHCGAHEQCGRQRHLPGRPGTRRTRAGQRRGHPRCRRRRHQ
jgi:hypothetical protein